MLVFWQQKCIKTQSRRPTSTKRSTILEDDYERLIRLAVYGPVRETVS